MRRTGLARAGVAALALAVGLGSTVPGAHAARQHANVTVTFWTAYTGKLGTTFNQLINNFQAKNPGITVNQVVSTSYTTLFPKEQSAVLAGGLPTAGQAYENWTAQFAKSHVIANLAPYISNKSYGLSSAGIKDFFPKLWADGNLGKNRYMMPFSKSDQVLYYNPNILKATGIKSPPKTWAEFAKDSAKVTKIQDGRATQWGSSWEISESTWYTWMKDWGSPVLNSKRHAVFANKDGLAAVQFFANLVKKQEAVFYPGTGFAGEADFDAGKTAFYVSTSAGLSFVLGAAKPGVVVKEAPIPAGPKGHATQMFGANFVIFSTAPAAERVAAWKFLRYITLPAQTAYFSINTGYMPVRKSALQQSDIKAYYKAHPDQKAPINSLAFAYVEPSYPQWTKARTDIESALGAALSLKESVPSAMKAAQSQANADMAKP
jgi:multiple sugar transport system substrate-binding protein